VGPGVGLDALEKRKSLVLPGIEPQFLVRPPNRPVITPPKLSLFQIVGTPAHLGRTKRYIAVCADMSEHGCQRSEVRTPGLFHLLNKEFFTEVWGYTFTSLSGLEIKLSVQV
jgi:hypothetical protein